MNKFSKPSGFAILIILFLVITFLPNRFGPKDHIPWRTDYAAATAESARVHKPIFIEFSATWCGPCQQMAHTTWADKDVAAALEAMIPVKVDVDQHPDLARQFGVNPIPAYALLDANENIVKFGEGYREPQEFLDWLRPKDKPAAEKPTTSP
jgi:thioredoxin-like negative regulator of GroEL